MGAELLKPRRRTVARIAHSYSATVLIPKPESP